MPSPGAMLLSIKFFSSTLSLSNSLIDIPFPLGLAISIMGVPFGAVITLTVLPFLAFINCSENVSIFKNIPNNTVIAIFLLTNLSCLPFFIFSLLFYFFHTPFFLSPFMIFIKISLFVKIK